MSGNGGDRDAMVLRFKPSAHCCVAAGAKTLDARGMLDPRYANLTIGDRLRGQDVHGRWSRLRVRSISKFAAGFGSAWSYYRALDREHELTPLHG